MIFQREAANTGLFSEMGPLLLMHFREIARYQDISLDPDFARYMEIEEMGALRIFTARKIFSKKLIGYSVFIVSPNLHYCSSLQAVQDVLFIHPKERGFGGRFILWCDQELRKEGVQVVMQHVNAAHDFGDLLERIGYEPIETVYSKRLDVINSRTPGLLRDEEDQKSVERLRLQEAKAFVKAVGEADPAFLGDLDPEESLKPEEFLWD